jgi:hypothetical protein
MKTLSTALLVVLALLLPLAAAAEEPEVAYAKFHRAAASGDLDEMLKYAPDAQKAELSAMSAAQRAAQVKMLAATMPRAFVVRHRVVNPDGQAARLWLTGTGTEMIGDKQETLYGNARMVLQRGEWKVSSSDWSPNDPGPLPSAKSSGPTLPKANAPAPKAAPAGRTAVGTLGSEPERKLGVQKPPCDYKPVMTAEDLQNCK